eukprot:5525674-Pyramimonas_sp.AAC.1
MRPQPHRGHPGGYLAHGKNRRNTETGSALVVVDVAPQDGQVDHNHNQSAHVEVNGLSPEGRSRAIE